MLEIVTGGLAIALVVFFAITKLFPKSKRYYIVPGAILGLSYISARFIQSPGRTLWSIAFWIMIGIAFSWYKKRKKEKLDGRHEDSAA